MTEPKRIKPGIRTTEAWAAVVATLVIALNKRLDLGISDEGCALLASLALAMIAGRSYVKAKASMLLACLGLALCSGCVIYTRTPEGQVSARGFFTKVGQLEFSETGTNGIKRYLTVKELNPDADAMRVVSAGVAEGVVAGMKGTP